VETVNGKITFKMLSTDTLYGIIDALQQLNNIPENALLIACCYEQYNGGSFNVEVNPDEQYKAIYEYGERKYKTFLKKTFENDIGKNRLK
jgi:hypothetical protein